MSQIDRIRAETYDRLLKATSSHKQQSIKDLSYLLQIAPESLPVEPELSNYSDIDKKVEVYSNWLEQRIALFRGEVISTNPGSIKSELDSSSTSSKIEIPKTDVPVVAEPEHVDYVELQRVQNSWFERIDQAMMDDFNFGRFPLSSGLKTAPIICSSNHDYLTKVCEGLGLSHKEIINVLDNPPMRLIQNEVVHLPGYGCVLRDSLIPKEDTQIIQATQSKQPLILIEKFQKYIQARWCDGIISELTEFGKQQVQLDLWQIRIGKNLGLEIPRWNEQTNTLNSINKTTRIAFDGWYEWLWDYLARKTRNPIGCGLKKDPPNMKTTWDIFKKISSLIPTIFDLSGIGGKIASVAEVAGYILFEKTKVVPNLLSNLLIQVENFADENDNSLQNSLGFRTRSALGWSLFSKLEANLGTYCVPYATLIAFNTLLPTGHEKDSTIEKSIIDQPLLNPNARLALLTFLNADAKYDPHGMAIAAWDKYRLDGPREYFKI